MKTLSPFTLAALIMGLGIAGIPLGDTAGKFMFLHTSIEPVFIAWSRYGLGVLLVWLVFAGRGFDFSAMKDWRLWLRSAFVTAAVFSILNSIATEPLANAFAAFFIGPIFAYFGSALFLKEQITWFRTITLVIAFGGVLIAVRPGVSMSPGLIYALMGGCFYAAFLVSTRWLSGVTSPRMLLLSNLILSSSLVDGSRIAPLIYMQVVYATLFGILFFGDYPDQWTWVGLAVLVSAGFASFFASNNRK